VLVRHVPARELPFSGVIGFRQWRKAYISDAKCRRVALRAPPPRRTHSPYSLAFRRQPAKSHLADLLTSPYSQRAPSTSTLIVWPGRTRCRHHCHTKTTAARPERVMLSPGRRSNPSRLVNHSATPSSRTLLHAKFGRAALLPSSSRSSSTLRVRLPGLLPDRVQAHLQRRCLASAATDQSSSAMDARSSPNSSLDADSTSLNHEGMLPRSPDHDELLISPCGRPCYIQYG